MGALLGGCDDGDAGPDAPDDAGSDADVADAGPEDAGPGDGGDEGSDGGDGDAPDAPEDGPPDDGGGDDAAPCGPGDGCGPTELCGDGLDNDCDGTVDEADAGCTCTHGDVQACFAGAPCRRAVGGCVDGWHACGPDGTWLPCAEGIWPQDETPDGRDDDCDGETDEGATGTPTIACPLAFESLPGRWFVLRCEDLCEPAPSAICDCVWSIRPPEGSGSVEVPDRDAETTRVYLDIAGNYLVTATIVDARLDTRRCTFAVRAVPAGFQVDLWWEDPDPWEPGNIDLHLHREPPRTPWFTDDDCHWGNGGGRDGTYLLDWGYAETPLDRCPDLPPERSWWDLVARGSCPNPRLALESFAGTDPETTSLDAPEAGDRFRVLAHYYEDGSPFGEVPTDAYVRVTCGGRPAFRFGPATMTSRDYGTGDLWRATDVEILDAAGNCTATPLGSPGAPDIQGDYSRDWF